jgi:hypothetical protein
VANALYPLWKQALMRELDEDKSLDQGVVDPVNGVYVSLVDIEIYAYSDGQQFYSEVTGVRGVPSMITNATVNGRVFAGDTVVFTNVTDPGGAHIGGIVLARQNSGANGTWRLVLYEDTGITGLPMIPSGGNIIVSWNVLGIFGL